MKPRGFTLVELLVALSIFAVLGLAGWQVLQQMIHTQHSIDSQSRQLRQLQRGFWLLGRDIRTLVDRPVRDNFGVREPAVTSVVPGFTLLLTSNDRPSVPGAAVSALRRVGYGLETGANGQQQLVRYLWPVLDRASDTEPQRQVVFDEVERLEIQFIDQQGQTSFYWPPANKDGVQQATVPAGIRLRLTLPGWGEIERVFQLRDVRPA